MNTQMQTEVKKNDATFAENTFTWQEQTEGYYWSKEILVAGLLVVQIYIVKIVLTVI